MAVFRRSKETLRFSIGEPRGYTKCNHKRAKTKNQLLLCFILFDDIVYLFKSSFRLIPQSYKAVGNNVMNQGEIITHRVDSSGAITAKSNVQKDARERENFTDSIKIW